jgi:hypothetical protein
MLKLRLQESYKTRDVIANAIPVPSALLIFCGDCHAEILLMQPDLQRDHQKNIGDAMSNAILAHKCRATVARLRS